MRVFFVTKRFSGHSKWSTIKHDKTANDITKSKLTSKLCKNITAAARTSGLFIPKLNQDPATNMTLSSAISVALQNQIPKVRIESAIKNATLSNGVKETFEKLYEVKCKGGVALLVECLTTSRARLNADLNFNLTKFFASADANVLFLFQRKGRIVVSAGDAKLDTNQIVERIIEDVDGVEDMKCFEREGKECVEVVCGMKETMTCRDRIKEMGLGIESAELFYVAKDMVAIDDENGKLFGSVVEYLEDHDDVIQIYHNCDE